MINPDNWNQLIASFPNTHVLQTWQWGMVKQHFGWEMLPKIWKNGNEIVGAALILKRKLPLFLGANCILYTPKGPLLRDWGDSRLLHQVFDELEAFARQQRALLVKIDPDIQLCRDHSDSLPQVMVWMQQSSSVADELLTGDTFLGYKIIPFLRDRGWTYSKEQVQFRNTVILDLTISENEIMQRMKQKTRYNIRLAERKGVKVREGKKEDIPLLYQMYAETSKRDGFIIRDEGYYTTTWGLFLANCPEFLTQEGEGCDPRINVWQPFAKILIAEYEGDPIAALILFVFGAKAWYMYGMSTERHREKMPNYLLHWRAIQWLRQIGVKEYDLWGAPERFDETDPMYGVYRFKIGFGGETVQHIGAWDFPVSKRLYRLYQEVLPRYLNILRLRKRMS